MRSPAAVTTLKVLAVLFFAYHMAGVTLAGLVPRASALSREAMPWFRDYLLATGNDNTWRMFIDRPIYRHYNVVLAVQTADGKQKRFGPVLPGLEPYDGSLHVLKVFYSYNNKRFLRYRRPYLQSAARQIQQRFGVTPKSIAIRYEVDKLETLAAIRRGGAVATRKNWQRGPR